ncbi:hypothetical protein FB45DRAFT_919360 [Roridomyces roridus]|uniref:Copper-fist domain-containing protein n=1 Tax=Roridomyces roridus TaxID=1738132 RepID=A0AAD7BS35_9AGAR|nr:hypothetical protein FB45DRAFT_919360 [Roridomyces roridus]
MVLISDKKYACETCIKGHRSSACKHTDRPLFEIKKKGRPVTQCEHCRELRKTKQVHVKCICEGKETPSPSTAPTATKKKGTPTLPAHAAFPHGVPEDANVINPPSSDSDHGGSCSCKEPGPAAAAGAACNCCIPRLRPSARRRSPSDDAPKSGPVPNPLPTTTLSSPSPPPSHSRSQSHHILARIAELRPVLPRPSARDAALSAQSGQQHDLFHHASPVHPHSPHHEHGFSPYGRAYDHALHGGESDRERERSGFYKQDGRSVESFASVSSSLSQISSPPPTATGKQASPTINTGPKRGKSHSAGASFDGGKHYESNGFFTPITTSMLPPSLGRAPASASSTSGAFSEGFSPSSMYRRSASDDVYRPGPRSDIEESSSPMYPPRPRSEEAFPSSSLAALGMTFTQQQMQPPPRARSEAGMGETLRACGCGPGCGCPGCALHNADGSSKSRSNTCTSQSCGGRCMDCTLLAMPEFAGIVTGAEGGVKGEQGSFDFAGHAAGHGYGDFNLDTQPYNPDIELNLEALGDIDMGWLDAEGESQGQSASQSAAIDEWIREVSALPPASPVPPFGPEQQQQMAQEPTWVFDVDPVALQTHMQMRGLAGGGGLTGGELEMYLPAPGGFLTVPGPAGPPRSRSSSSASSSGVSVPPVAGPGEGDVRSGAPPSPPLPPRPGPVETHPSGQQAAFGFAPPPPGYMDDGGMLFY